MAVHSDLRLLERVPLIWNQKRVIPADASGEPGPSSVKKFRKHCFWVLPRLNRGIIAGMTRFGVAIHSGRNTL